MNPTKKIYSALFIWLLVTTASFYYVFPKFAAVLVNLQQDHQDQIAQYNSLQAQIQSLYAMQQDLDSLSKAAVKPDDLFTTDVQLVNEIQHIEDIAKISSNTLKVTISGTAKDAQAYPGFSKLYKVPYSMTLVGSFSSTLQFLHYFENSFFVSPIDAINIDNQQALTAGQVKTTIIAGFFIRVK